MELLHIVESEFRCVSSTYLIFKKKRFYANSNRFPTDMFAFDLYDTDGSGELSPSEVIKLLQEIFGKNEMKTDVHAKR